MTQIAKELNVSDSAIRKWAKQYNLILFGPGYWQKEQAKKVRPVAVAATPKSD